MRIASLVFLLAAAGPAPAVADCLAIHEQIRAFSASPAGVDAAARLQAALLAEPTCDAAYRDTAGRVIAHALLRQASTTGDASAEAARAALRFGRPWPVLAALGDAEYRARRYAEATRAYEEALDDLRDEKRNPQAPPREVEERLVKRAYQARALAPSYVALTRSMRGAPAGIANTKFRTFAVAAVPVPVRFDYDSARLTEDGERAVADIGEHLAGAGAAAVRLVGHTDPRGSDAYNDRLSLARAQAVAQALAARGFKGKIEVVGKGRRDRFAADDPGAYSEEQLFAFDRRVEFQVLD